MQTHIARPIGGLALLALVSAAAHAQIHAMANYETKSPDSLKALKSPITPPARKEGIAIIDVDPDSKTFGQIVQDLPLPGDLVAHHIFYNRDQTKAYVTALGKSELRVIDMSQKPLQMKVVAVPDCAVGEDVVFSDDNKKWYLSCMGSQAMIVGDAVTDQPLSTVKVGLPYPHGIAIHNGIDRILTTSTVRASDLGDPGEGISVIEASSGKVLASHKLSNKPSPAGEAPVEILFVPGSSPPVAYITNMYGGTLWTAAWNPASKAFDVAQAHDFSGQKAGVPLEIYFSKNGERMYVTTAKPGHLHIFDTSTATRPKLLKSIATAEGAHHVAFTKDGRYAFVQNTLLNLPGMSDGSITVIDLKTETAVRSIDTLKSTGFNPNSLVLLPQWNDPAGH
ncbi:MAG TPA: YncE family protein [Casimicrobiaceae bacterium]|nr:YncE family protein [Casimicrobiaceae bacterium]